MCFKNQSNRSVCMAIACTIFFLASHAKADTLEYVKQCDGCHGKNGASVMSVMPSIGGISPLIFEEYMLQYREESRPCGSPVNMCAFAQMPSEEEILEISVFYGDQKFVAATQEFDSEKAALGAEIHQQNCEICHSNGGSDASDDAGILAGQWMPYLEKTFAEYSAGERGMMEDNMKTKIDALDEESIVALINFYASMQ